MTRGNSSSGRSSARRIRNLALLLAAIAVAFYLGFILLGVLRA